MTTVFPSAGNLMRVVALAAAVGWLAGCEDEGPAEQTGQQIDETMEDAGEALDAAGDAVEDAVEEMERDLDAVGDQMEGAMDDMEGEAETPAEEETNP